MSFDWPIVKINDVADVKSGKRLPKEHLLVDEKTEFPYIRLVDINNGEISRDNLKYLEPKTRKVIKQYIVNTGDVCLAIVGHTIGLVFYIDSMWDDVNLTENAARITGLSSHINSKFLYYYLSSEIGHNQIISRIVGSAQGKLPLYNIKSLEFPSPPKFVQDEIVSILDALNNRISLLRETNTTLEAIAQTLFKSWFVDFDPVKAKAESCLPEGMDEATAALFPSEFEESALGLIPKGWSVRNINQVCDLGRGSSPRPIQQYMGNDVPWIKIADATASDGMFVFETKEKIIKKGVKNSMPVKHGDLIMSNSASCGITVFVELEGCIHDGWLYFKNYQFVTKGFLFFWLRKIAAHLISIADGTVQKNLNIAMVSSQLILCPPANIVDAFEDIASSLLIRIRENCKQYQTLTTLRDTLLPRLISGQLRLNQAQEIMDEVGA